MSTQFDAVLDHNIRKKGYMIKSIMQSPFAICFYLKFNELLDEKCTTHVLLSTDAVVDASVMQQ